MSAKSASRISLNDMLLVGPTVHPPLMDVLLRFRMHRVALTTNVSKMYRAVELVRPLTETITVLFGDWSRINHWRITK